MLVLDIISSVHKSLYLNFTHILANDTQTYIYMHIVLTHYAFYYYFKSLK